MMDIALVGLMIGVGVGIAIILDVYLEG